LHKVKIETELHVTTPNEPGILGRVLGTLANSGINLVALNVYTEKNKGTFLLITTDNKKAKKCLKSLGYEVKTNSVISVMLSDRIGAGAEIGALLGNSVINVKYCYISSSGNLFIKKWRCFYYYFLFNDMQDFFKNDY